MSPNSRHGRTATHTRRLEFAQTEQDALTTNRTECRRGTRRALRLQHKGLQAALARRGLVALPLPLLWALRRLWRTLARLHALDDPEGDAYRKEIERGRMTRFGCSRHHPANTQARGR